jgi:hypothetical protein
MSEETSKTLSPLLKKKSVSNASPRFFDGGKRSIAVLKANGFCPITELITQYGKLQLELKYWEDVRDGKIIRLGPNGKEVRSSYNSDAHMAVYNLLITVGDKLLRYGYGRVPENLPDAPTRPQALVINLTTDDGNKTYSINNGEEFTDAEIVPDEDD